MFSALSNGYNFNRFKKIMFFSEHCIKNGKQICAIFFQFKLGHKVAETACNINQAFGIGPTTEHTAKWWFKKFHAGNESLEDD